MSLLKIFFISFMLAIISCSSKNSNNNEIEFSTDSTMIGSEIKITNYDFLFNPPVNYSDLNDYIMKLKEKSAENQTLLNAFGNIEDKNMCFISNYTYEQNVNDSVFLKEFLSNKTTPDFKFGSFIHNKIKFYQLRIDEEEKTIFSLWSNIQKNNFIKFDYILTNPISHSDIRAVESSISTIKKIKQGD